MFTIDTITYVKFHWSAHFQVLHIKVIMSRLFKDGTFGTPQLRAHCERGVCVAVLLNFILFTSLKKVRKEPKRNWLLMF